MHQEALKCPDWQIHFPAHPCHPGCPPKILDVCEDPALRGSVAEHPRYDFACKLRFQLYPAPGWGHLLQPTQGRAPDNSPAETRTGSSRKPSSGTLSQHTHTGGCKHVKLLCQNQKAFLRSFQSLSSIHSYNNLRAVWHKLLYGPEMFLKTSLCHCKLQCSFSSLPQMVLSLDLRVLDCSKGTPTFSSSLADSSYK